MLDLCVVVRPRRVRQQRAGGVKMATREIERDAQRAGAGQLLQCGHRAGAAWATLGRQPG